MNDDSCQLSILYVYHMISEGGKNPYHKLGYEDHHHHDHSRQKGANKTGQLLNNSFIHILQENTEY